MLPLLAVLLGCIGQSVFYARGAGMRSWLSTGVLLLPWAVLFFSNFTQVAPFPRRDYFRVVFGAMFWWSIVTVATELFLVFGIITPLPLPQMIAAQILMNMGWFGFVPLRRLKRTESTKHPSPTKH